MREWGNVVSCHDNKCYKNLNGSLRLIIFKRNTMSFLLILGWNPTTRFIPEEERVQNGLNINIMFLQNVIPIKINQILIKNLIGRWCSNALDESGSRHHILCSLVTHWKHPKHDKSEQSVHAHIHKHMQQSLSSSVRSVSLSLSLSFLFLPGNLTSFESLISHDLHGDAWDNYCLSICSLATHRL